MLLLIAGLAVLAAAPSARGGSEPAKPDACRPPTTRDSTPPPDLEIDTSPHPDRLGCQADERLRQGDEQLRQYLDVEEENQRLVDAQTAYGEARDLYRQAGERGGEAKALLGLARALDYLEFGKEARSNLAALRELYRQPAAGPMDAVIILALAEVGQDLDDSDNARSDYKKAIALFREGGNHAGEATAWAGLAIIEQRGGHAPAAHDDFVAARDLLKQVPDGDNKASGGMFKQFLDPSNRGYALLGLADLAKEGGEGAAAQAGYTEARLVFQKVTNRGGEGFALLGLAEMKAAQGDAEGARSDYEAARQLFQGVGEHEGEARLLVSRAAFARRLGDNAQAGADYADAQDIFGRLEDDASQASALLELGDVDGELDEQDFATQAYDQAR
jgi:tetratricopeptide (TPR) repeat protein